MKSIAKKILAVFLAVMMVLPSAYVLDNIGVTQAITAQAATKKTAKTAKKTSKKSTKKSKKSTKKSSKKTTKKPTKKSTKKSKKKAKFTAPKNLKLKVKASNSFDVSFSKVNGANGYVIYYSTSKKFTKKTTKKVKVKVTKKNKKKKTITKRIKKLKNKKKYYVRVKAYKTVKKKTTYTKYSSVKSIKTKKVKASTPTTTTTTTTTTTPVEATTSVPTTAAPTKTTTDQVASTTVPNTNAIVKYTVTFNTNGGTAIAPLTIVSGSTIDLPIAPTKDKAVFLGWYTDSEFKNGFLDSTAITANITLYAKWETDSDNDKLTDELEDKIGTDKFKKDTDGDGLTDYEECYLTETDPIKKDSDDNGINDGNEDFDNDGLTNAEEIKAGTNCRLADTDGDGLNDYDEINKYKTNPLVADTDNDGLNDGDEIALGLNPLMQKTDGKTLDSQRRFDQKTDSESFVDKDILSDENPVVPVLSGNISGNINSKVSIDKNSDTVLTENRAVVGYPIEISKSIDDSLTLSFDMSNSDIKSDSSEINKYVICQYNEKGINPVATNIDKSASILSTTVKDSGTYFVVDSSELLSSLGVDVDKYIEGSMPKLKSDGKTVSVADHKVSGQADIIFVIDTTGSMSDEIANVKSNVKKFAERLSSEYDVSVNFALVDYRDNTVLEEDVNKLYTPVVHRNGTSNWFGNSYVDNYKNEINNLYIGYGGDGPETALDALEFSRNLDFRSTASKFMILVTDADNKVSNPYGINDMDEMADLLAKDGICTSVITSSSYSSEYSALYTKTDGIYANIYGNFADELLKIADKIGEVTNDGSWVLLDDFQFVKLDEKPTAGSTVDTDGDGVADIDELGSTVEIDISEFLKHEFSKRELEYAKYYTGPTSVTAYKYVSNPCLKDTDGDMYDDKIDSAPRVFTITDATLMKLADWSYSKVEDGERVERYKVYDYVDIKNGKAYSTANKNAKAKVVYLNGYSGKLSKDHGFGAVAFKIELGNGKSSLVYALRGTEKFDDVNDVLTDVKLSAWGDSAQSETGYKVYNTLAQTYCDSSIYLTGHSLGGRLVLDVLYKAQDRNEVKMPLHSATFNGLGYDKSVKFFALSNKVMKKYADNLNNYYYENDFVGDQFGDSALYAKPGHQIKLYPNERTFMFSWDNHGNILSDDTLMNKPYEIKEFYSSHKLNY